MPRSPADAAYLRQMRALRERTGDALFSAFIRVDEDDIAGSVERYARTHAEAVGTAKLAAQHLVTAYLVRRAQESGVAFAPVGVLSSIATSGRDGVSVRDGLAAIVPVVLARIAEGWTPREAIESGARAQRQVADSELLAAADAELAHQAEAHDDVAIGWEADLASECCATCRIENGGIHDMDDPVYRHPSCRCEIRPYFGAAA